MLTKMTEEDWVLVHEVFHACRSRRGDKGRDDRKFFEALHYFTVHNITWRALPAEFGSWNSIWKRFWRLSRSGVFETFFEALASLSERAHLVQMFDFDRHPRECVGGRRKRGQDGEALGRSGKLPTRSLGSASVTRGNVGDSPPRGVLATEEPDAKGVVTSLKEEHENSAPRIFSNDRDCLAPHVHSRRAKGSVRSCRSEMTLDVESVVGGCVS